MRSPHFGGQQGGIHLVLEKSYISASLNHGNKPAGPFLLPDNSGLQWCDHSPEPDILECQVEWALGSIIMKKVSGGDGIPGELFKILKDDAVKVLHSTCQHIWKTQ